MVGPFHYPRYHSRTWVHRGTKIYIKQTNRNSAQISITHPPRGSWRHSGWLRLSWFLTKQKAYDVTTEVVQCIIILCMVVWLSRSFVGRRVVHCLLFSFSMGCSEFPSIRVCHRKYTEYSGVRNAPISISRYSGVRTQLGTIGFHFGGCGVGRQGEKIYFVYLSSIYILYTYLLGTYLLRICMQWITDF